MQYTLKSGTVVTDKDIEAMVAAIGDLSYDLQSAPIAKPLDDMSRPKEAPLLI